MKVIKITDKKDYLEKHYPFEEVPELNDKKRCIHCDSEFLLRISKYVLMKTKALNTFVVQMHLNVMVLLSIGFELSKTPFI
jgi:hypothetical protein